MAAVVAKNAVGSSWRKTLGSREWSRVPGGSPPATAILVYSEHGKHKAQALAGAQRERAGPDSPPAPAIWLPLPLSLTPPTPTLLCRRRREAVHPVHCHSRTAGRPLGQGGAAGTACCMPGREAGRKLPCKGVAASLAHPTG